MSNEFTSSGVVVTSGNANIASGKIWCDTVVSDGGYLNVLAGGVTYGSVPGAATVGGSRAQIKVWAGGTLSKTTVSSGGKVIVSGGMVSSGGKSSFMAGSATELDIKRNGSASVSSGGVITSSFVSGHLVASNGGSACENTVTGGTATIARGGFGISNFVNAGSLTVSNGGIDSASIVSGGTFAVSSGGVAADTVIKRGSQTVFAGGTAVSAVVSSGAQLISGGFASETVILAQGTQTVLSGSAVSAVVGGLQQVAKASAFAENAVISSGGSQFVSNGGTAVNTIVLNGGMVQFASGGILAGEENISDIGGAANFDEGAVVEGKFFTKGEVTVGGDITFTNADSGIYLWLDAANIDSISGKAMLHNFNLLGEDAGNCFISVPGDIADNTYTLADGAEGFTGSLGIYNDDWVSKTYYVSVGETISANYIDYTLSNDNGTLKVSVVNNTIYDKTFNSWNFSAGNVASLEFSLNCAGRFKLGDFINANNFSGSAVIKDPTGKIVASLKIAGGTVAEGQKNDFLLDEGDYTLICTPEKGGAIKENSFAHIESIDLFFRANLYDDDSFNSLVEDAVRITVAPGENGIASAVISDGDNYYEFVGYSDLSDWRQLNVAQDGVYSIDLTKKNGTGTALKATLYSVSGTKLTSIATVSLKDTAEAALLIKDKQLASGTYYVKFESTSGSKGYGSIYGASISGKVYDVSSAEDRAALTTTLTLSEVSSGRVNFASPEVFYSWNVISDGIYTLSLAPEIKQSSGNNALTITVYTMNEGKTALTKVLSFKTKNVSSGDAGTIFSSKSVFFAQGEYFISVKSANTAKGADVGFVINSTAETVYPVAADNAENFRNAKRVQLNATIKNDIYAGFGAATEFLALDMDKRAPYGGKFTFDVANTGNGKAVVTIWMQIGNKLKKVKSVTAAAGKTVSLAGVTFDPAEKYFIQIDGAAAAKSKQYANISITASPEKIFTADTTPELAVGASSFAAAAALEIKKKKSPSLLKAYASGGDDQVSWFNFDLKDEVANGGIFSFTVSNTGSGAAAFAIYQLSDDGNSVKKVKSVSVAAGKTVTFDSLSLTGNGVYFCQIDSTAAAKKGLYSEISVSTTAAWVDPDATPEKVFSSDDAIWQLAPEYCFDIAECGSVNLARDAYLGGENDTDFRKITLDHAGWYNLALKSNKRSANLTVTIYQWNAAGTALVKVGSTTLSASTAAGNATLKKDVFLTAGDYYVSVECANTGKGGYGTYTLDFNAPVVFDHADISSLDDDVCNAQNIDGEKEYFAGYGDAQDFFVWNVEHDGYYNYTLSSSEQNAKLTATLYTWNAAGTALVKLGTVNLSAAGDDATLKKDLLLDKGEYFIGVSCANTAKGGYGCYSLSTGSSLVFDHTDNDNSDNSAASAKTAIVADGDTVLVGKDMGFVGYGDKYDFINLTAAQSGEYTFNIETSNALKFTLYRYDLASGKMAAVIKTVKLKADTVMAPVHLEAGVEYYAALEAGDAKKETIYSLSASGKTAAYIDAAFDQDAAAEIGALSRGGTALVNFNVTSADAGWEYTFASSDNGSLELYMYNESKGVLSQVKTVPGKDIQLASGSYYIQLEAAASLADTTALVFDADTRTFSWE